MSLGGLRGCDNLLSGKTWGGLSQWLTRRGEPWGSPGGVTGAWQMPLPSLPEVRLFSKDLPSQEIPLRGCPVRGGGTPSSLGTVVFQLGEWPAGHLNVEFVGEDTLRIP